MLVGFLEKKQVPQTASFLQFLPLCETFRNGIWSEGEDGLHILRARRDIKPGDEAQQEKPQENNVKPPKHPTLAIAVSNIWMVKCFFHHP